jgi:uracil-DNA glycosylase family 4
MVQIDLFDTELNSILNAARYQEFSEKLKKYNCQRCRLCYSRSNIVVDRGNPETPIMIISERPGDNEDIQGKAFVGRAGELLGKMFAAISMSTDKDVLITNVVKCKPEIDRSPSKDEVEACAPFLEKQIELVRPKIIVLLGAVALKGMAPERGEIKMEDEAGSFFPLARFPGILFMVLYHPAFLLRDPRKKVDTWAHLKSLRSYLEKTGLV